MKIFLNGRVDQWHDKIGNHHCQHHVPHERQVVSFLIRELAPFALRSHRTTYLDHVSGITGSSVVILFLDVIEDLLQFALQERQDTFNERNDGLQMIFAEHSDQQERLVWHVSVSVDLKHVIELTCTKTALMTALPINVAKKKVLNGTNKWPAVRPARSNKGLGTDANNKMPKKPKRPKLLTTNWIDAMLILTSYNTRCTVLFTCFNRATMPLPSSSSSNKSILRCFNRSSVKRAIKISLISCTNTISYSYCTCTSHKVRRQFTDGSTHAPQERWSVR